MRKSTYVPPIVFTGFKIQGHPADHPIDNLKELELKASQRNVTFQFAALDYVNPDNILYAYRLQGLEDEWNEVDNNRSASYINLPAGQYQLQIKSTNSDGVWTDNIRTLSIHVLPDILGNLLGMATLFHPVYLIHRHHCICSVLYLPSAPPSRHGTTTRKCQATFLHRYFPTNCVLR